MPLASTACAHPNTSRQLASAERSRRTEEKKKKEKKLASETSLAERARRHIPLPSPARSPSILVTLFAALRCKAAFGSFRWPSDVLAAAVRSCRGSPHCRSDAGVCEWIPRGPGPRRRCIHVQQSARAQKDGTRASGRRAEKTGSDRRRHRGQSLRLSAFSRPRFSLHRTD